MGYSLFSQYEANNYFSLQIGKVSSSIEHMSDAEITGSDEASWAEYYYQLFEAHPIELRESAITQAIKEIKIKEPNPYRFYDEPEYYYTDGVRIIYRIPFNGDGYLLDLTPSRRYLTSFPCDSVTKPTDHEYGFILFGAEYTSYILQQHSEDMQQFVLDGFNKSFSNYRDMITYINDDAKRYNENLRETIKQALESRKRRAASIAFISEKLEIPLTMSSSAPNTRPIVLEKIAKPHIQKPQKKLVQTEYSIRDEDYLNINNIIYMCGSSMEKAARSYTRNDEEELRDFILATLNTHYQNASGETFRKIGKTDILIQFENQAAFIGECKIWHGEGVFTDAIHQLFGYSTWKDTKVTLIVFNKFNKGFSSILSIVDRWIEKNTKMHLRQSANRWDCTFYREETGAEVKLHVVVFDLYVDTKQINREHHD